MSIATIGTRFQVVIPKEERRRLNLKPRTQVRVEARDGHLVIYPVGGQPLRGLGRDLADGQDAGGYIEQLRREWGSRS